jgi:hypothetical protein
MVAPKWLHTKCQPIGIANVLDFLIFTLFKEQAYHKILISDVIMF